MSAPAIAIPRTSMQLIGVVIGRSVVTPPQDLLKATSRSRMQRHGRSTDQMADFGRVRSPDFLPNVLPTSGDLRAPSMTPRGSLERRGPHGTCLGRLLTGGLLVRGQPGESRTPSAGTVSEPDRSSAFPYPQSPARNSRIASYHYWGGCPDLGTWPRQRRTGLIQGREPAGRGQGRGSIRRPFFQGMATNARQDSPRPVT